MLVLSRKQQQQIQISDRITVTILRVKGQTVRLGIEAPEGIRILRSEIADPGQRRGAPTHAPGSPTDADELGADSEDELAQVVAGGRGAAALRRLLPR